MTVSKSTSAALLTPLLVIILAFAGCDVLTTGDTASPDSPDQATDGQPPKGNPARDASFTLSSGEVCDVLGATAQGEGINLLVLFDGTAKRSIRINGVATPRGWRGFAASIHHGPKLSFGFELQYEVDGYDALVSEFTPSDRLLIRRRLDPGQAGVRESYSGNASPRVASGYLPIIDEVPVVPAAARPDFNPDDIRGMAPTVFDNVDGERLMLLLDQHEFVSWLGQRLASEFGSEAGRAATGGGCPTWLSAGATLCATFKCTFGGGALNPGCIACTGVGLACAVADLACNYLVDCN
ncbi:hypothetical protein DRQ53_05950 [bacterium]|nr:MAG: hypothetical protein DRQ32_00975 [bacterium]RKZ16594.1 MAG: hypothetical protein DRQ53_05950 [bacterium]